MTTTFNWIVTAMDCLPQTPDVKNEASAPAQDAA